METELKSFKTVRTKLQNEIKDLKSEVTTLRSERDEKNKVIDTHQRSIKDKEKQLEELRKQESEFKGAADGIIISEHALIRYFERVLGFDIEKIKREMIPEKVQSQIHLMKSGVFPVGEYRLRVRTGTVVTVLTED